MTAPFFQRNSTGQDLYNSGLSSVYRSFRIYDPGYALARDADVYEKIRRDVIIHDSIQKRRHAVAGPTWVMDPASDDPMDKIAAGVMKELIKRIKHFSTARFNLAEAVLLGSKFSFIEGRYQTTPIWDHVPRRWWIPQRLRDVDRRRFAPIIKRNTWDDGICVEWNFWSVARATYEKLEHPEWFIKHLYDDNEASLGFGRGLIDAIYFYWRAKELLLTEGLAGVERWAQGFLIAKIDNAREASTGLPNVQLVDNWKSVV